MQPRRISSRMVRLQGYMRANYCKVSKIAAERRGLGSGGRAGGSKHQFNSVPRETNDLLFDEKHSAFEFIRDRNAFDLPQAMFHVVGPHLKQSRFRRINQRLSFAKVPLKF